MLAAILTMIVAGERTVEVIKKFNANWFREHPRVIYVLAFVVFTALNLWRGLGIWAAVDGLAPGSATPLDSIFTAVPMVGGAAVINPLFDLIALLKAKVKNTVAIG